MADDFHPEQFTDTYQEQLKELVEAKLQGGEAFSTEDQPAQLDETEDVSDLLAKLEASVRKRRGESGHAATDGQAATSDGAGSQGPGEESPREDGDGRFKARPRRPPEEVAGLRLLRELLEPAAGRATRGTA